VSRRNLSADVRVLVGDPAESIVETARRGRYSEIVMGTRGLGTLKGLLLGSVVTKVIQLSRVPVTVVP
jgi:nucleotide-binding universal stress UspA family protein